MGQTFSAAELVNPTDLICPPVVDEHTRRETARKLYALSKRLAEHELRAAGPYTPPDDEDMRRFLEGLEAQVTMCDRMGQWPAEVYEEYSTTSPVRRSAELIEALQYFIMRGRTALLRCKPDRGGFVLQLHVF
jgi:hypothetical protein